MNRLAETIAHKRTEIEPLIEYTAEWQEKARKLSSFRGFRNRLALAPLASSPRSRKHHLLRA